VSPLWRDEVGAYLSPHRLCLVRMKRGAKPTHVAEHELRFEGVKKCPQPELLCMCGGYVGHGGELAADRWPNLDRVSAEQLKRPAVAGRR